MIRRDFLKLSTTTAVAIAISPSLITEKLYADDGRLYQTFEKVLLKNEDGTPIKSSDIKKEENYIFHYPYVSTPAILVDLPSPAEKNITLTAEDGTKYLFTGGVGKEGTLIAYSAICPHQLTHPTRKMSMFNYVPSTGKTIAHKGGEVFVCSSHLSVFNPKYGGKKVSGPATQGLASVILEIDNDDHLWAVGILGPDKFHDFFDVFKKDLKEQYGRRGAKKLTKQDAIIQTITKFTEEIIVA